MTNLDRRSSPRTSVAYQITYECFDYRGDKIGEGAAHTVNLSGRGALVEMPHRVEAAASMILWILAPFYTLLVKGDIVHTYTSANGAYRVGVRLTEVIEGSWSVLEQDIQRHLPQPDYARPSDSLGD